MARQPGVVAELGRPETPEETAARKAASSRAHRQNQSLRNLILSLLATLAVVGALVAVVVRPDPQIDRSIDWHETATQVAGAVDPRLPEGWTANAAGLRDDEDSEYWYVGFVTPKGDFIALEQRTADPEWIEDHIDTGSAPAIETIDAMQWAVYETDDEGNYGTIWETTFTPSGITETDLSVGTQVDLHGSADAAEFETLAAAVAEAVAL
jgi:hypothetical protein